MSTTLRPSPRVDVPEHAFVGDVPLVAVGRGGHVGSLHRGTAAVVDVSGELIMALGDTRQPAFLRSAAKPFQVMPAILTGAVDRFEVSDRELAVMCASHSAEPRHTETILDILQRTGLEESALRCGVHPPLHEQTARGRWRAGLEPTPVCNNCSGAHTGMLLACLVMGWSIDDYGRPDHPLQVMTREILTEFSGGQPEQVRLATDNCAVPTFLLLIECAARAFARLATGRGVRDDLARAAERVVRAMTSHPDMVAGEGRFDTALMRAAGGSLVSKGGAEGYQGIGVRREGWGIAIKISDGNTRATPPTAMRILSSLGILTPAQQEELMTYAEPEVHNHQGELVGRLTPVFEIGEPA